MADPLIDYFAGEKRESVAFICAGVVSIAVVVWLWRGTTPWRGAVYPLAIFGLIQLVVGGAIYLRTNGQVATLEAARHEAPASFRGDERARMKVVVRNFRVYRWVELAVIALGLVLLWRFPDRPALHAAGAGCVAQAGLTLILDLFAEARADRYLRWLNGT
jgi:hypothetical protein